MLVKINEYETIENDNNQDNDLYRKFRTIFMKILHPDENNYNVKTYIKTRNEVEEKVKAILESDSDGIVEILGYTGMGKTFLMHYCIKTLYNFEGLMKNKVLFIEKRMEKI